MLYLWLKSFHLVGLVTWFAGLFYLVRLFVYAAEAAAEPEPARGTLRRQYAVMEGRLLRIIATPGLIVTFACGVAMLTRNPALLREPWMHVKLTLVLGLAGYHGWAAAEVRRHARGTWPADARRMRVLNELPTVVLVSVVTLAVLKRQASLGAQLALAAGTVVLLGAGIQLYAALRRRRDR